MDQPPAIVINDPGGLVWLHESAGRNYAKAGTKLIVAYCASACLNLIAQVPKENICFRRSAWIGYHTKSQHENDAGLCCIESTITMRWERGTDWIKRGFQECK